MAYVFHTKPRSKLPATAPEDLVRLQDVGDGFAGHAAEEADLPAGGAPGIWVTDDPPGHAWEWDPAATPPEWNDLGPLSQIELHNRDPAAHPDIRALIGTGPGGNGLPRGELGIYTRGTDFDGAGLPDLQEFLDDHINGHWFQVEDAGPTSLTIDNGNVANTSRTVTFRNIFLQGLTLHLQTQAQFADTVTMSGVTGAVEVGSTSNWGAANFATTVSAQNVSGPVIFSGAHTHATFNNVSLFNCPDVRLNPEWSAAIWLNGTLTVSQSNVLLEGQGPAIHSYLRTDVNSGGRLDIVGTLGSTAVTLDRSGVEGTRSGWTIDRRAPDRPLETFRRREGGAVGTVDADDVAMANLINVTVPGGVGGWPNGASVAPTDSVWDVLRRLLNPRIPPTYVAPTLTLSGTTPLAREIGENVTATLTPNFQQNDGGAITQYRLSRDGANILTNPTAMAHTDAAFQLAVNVTYQAAADFAQGPVKPDSEGVNDPTGQIQAGTITSAAVTYTPQRRGFFGPLAAPPAPTTSATVRGLASNVLGPGNNTQMVVNIVNGRGVSFAYPATLRALTSIFAATLGSTNLVSQFAETSVTVEGANGYAGVAYRVYSMTTAVPFSDTYTATI